MNKTRIPLLALASMTAMVAGCGQEPPKCSGEATLTLVRNILIDQLGGRKGVTDQELIDNIRFEFPRPTALDEKIKKYTCEAKLIAGGDTQMPISYESQLDDNNHHLVFVGEITDDVKLHLIHAISQGIQKGREAKQATAKRAPAQAVTPQAANSRIVGVWQGTFDGGAGTMTIKPGNRGYEIDLAVGAPGCGGSIEGIAQLVDDTLTLVKKDEGEICIVNVVFSGNDATVSENNCLAYHGPACGFDGVLHKAK